MIQKKEEPVSSTTNNAFINAVPVLTGEATEKEIKEQLEKLLKVLVSKSPIELKILRAYAVSMEGRFGDTTRVDVGITMLATLVALVAGFPIVGAAILAAGFLLYAVKDLTPTFNRASEMVQRTILLRELVDLALVQKQNLIEEVEAQDSLE